MASTRVAQPVPNPKGTPNTNISGKAKGLFTEPPAIKAQRTAMNSFPVGSPQYLAARRTLNDSLQAAGQRTNADAGPGLAAHSQVQPRPAAPQASTPTPGVPSLNQNWQGQGFTPPIPPGMNPYASAVPQTPTGMGGLTRGYGDESTANYGGRAPQLSPEYMAQLQTYQQQLQAAQGQAPKVGQPRQPGQITPLSTGAVPQGPSLPGNYPLYAE